MSEVLRVGAARTNVTPPVGIDISGFCLRDISLDIHQPLYIRAAIFGAPMGTVALVSCELLGLTPPFADQLRRDIASTLSIPADHVLLACTHTHSAPALEVGLKIGGKQEEWTDLNETYTRFFRYQLLSTVKRAQASMRPARCAASIAGSVRIGVNRRFRLEDGRMIIGRNWNGPSDHSVGVLRVDTLEGEPICTVINYACHPITLGPESNVISPDYPGEACRILEKETGVPCLFLQGCCGDIAPIEGMGADMRVAERLGAELGYMALAIWAGIETRNIVEKEIIVQSYNAIATLLKEERPSPPPVVRVMLRYVRLPMQPLPASDEIDRIAARESGRYDSMVHAGASEGELNIQRIELRWVRALQRAREEARHQREVEAAVQAIRVNDWAMVGLPVEPFVRIGLRIKEQLVPHPILVVGYANGTVGYVPMPEDYSEGGYEVERAHHVYGQATALAPTASTLLTTTAIDLLRELFEN